MKLSFENRKLRITSRHSTPFNKHKILDSRIENLFVPKHFEEKGNEQKNGGKIMFSKFDMIM